MTIKAIICDICYGQGYLLEVSSEKYRRCPACRGTGIILHSTRIAEYTEDKQLLSGIKEKARDFCKKVKKIK